MTMTSTDRIQKSTMIRAPRTRVWRALTDAKEFGTWFGADFDGSFAVGARIKGKIRHKGYEHMPLEVTVVKMEPETLFSFRWHPYPIDAAYDYSKDPTTLIEFTLEEAAEGTLLTVTESGFDQVPLARRVKAFEMNDKGWAGQLKAIDEYLNRTK